MESNKQGSGSTTKPPWKDANNFPTLPWPQKFRYNKVSCSFYAIIQVIKIKLKGAFDDGTLSKHV